MFEGDYADNCPEKFPLMSMGTKRSVACAQTQERGPPSALAEFFLSHKSLILKGEYSIVTTKKWTLRFLE